MTKKMNLNKTAFAFVIANVILIGMFAFVFFLSDNYIAGSVMYLAMIIIYHAILIGSEDE